MNKIINTINYYLRLPEKIPCDKRIHALGGSFIMFLLLLFPINWIISFIILILIAFGVEFYQKFTKSGNFDILDAVAVILGGLLVLIPFLKLYY